MNENIQKPIHPLDIWNKQKKIIEDGAIRPDLHCFEREIWWCSLGKNIGSEENGKHELFERPVIIFRKFGKDMIWAIPLTTQAKDRESRDFYTFTTSGITRSAHFSQMRPISVKRLIRYIDIISYEDFQVLRKGIAGLA